MFTSGERRGFIALVVIMTVVVIVVALISGSGSPAATASGNSDTVAGQVDTIVRDTTLRQTKHRSHRKKRKKAPKEPRSYPTRDILSDTVRNR